ncbi:MAG: hypothetical protein MZW92_59520 [Comamonadaceae bacterium]|nr:hypothetical protein [Comamonadaceae bacterium]
MIAATGTQYMTRKSKIGEKRLDEAFEAEDHRVGSPEQRKDHHGMDQGQDEEADAEGDGLVLDEALEELHHVVDDEAEEESAAAPKPMDRRTSGWRR